MTACEEFVAGLKSFLLPVSLMGPVRSVAHDPWQAEPWLLSSRVMVPRLNVSSSSLKCAHVCFGVGLVYYSLRLQCVSFISGCHVGGAGALAF